MGLILPSSAPCCTPCPDPQVIDIPGPQGPSGAAGTNGTDGVDAFTVVQAQFAMPGFGASTASPVTVLDTSWMAVNELVFLGVTGGAAQGTLQVVTINSGTTVTLKNVSTGATSADAYASNSAPGIVFPVGTIVTPVGPQGIPGTAGSSGAPTTSTYITKTLDPLLTNSQVLSILATGMVKVTTGTGALSTGSDGTDYLSSTTGLTKAGNLAGLANTATSRTNLGVSIGSDVQAYSAFLAGLVAAGPGVADRFPYLTAANTFSLATLTAFARTLLATANLAAAQALLGIGSMPVVTKTGSYNATISDGLILCDCTTGAMTIGLPAAATATGKELIVKKIDVSANAVTLDANLAEKIDGQLTQIISSQWTAVDMICDGSNWFIV